MNYAKVVVAALAVVCIAMPARGVDFQELVSWSVINGDPGTTPSKYHYAWTIDGTTSYHQIGYGEYRITKVEDFATSPVMTTLVSEADWAAATGKTTLTAFYGFGHVAAANALQFSTSSTDEVYRVDMTSGAITAYATQADILAASGGISVQLLSTTEVWGTEQVFYEGKTDQILMTDGPNNVIVLVSTTELVNAQGNSSVSGGLGPAANGDLYWGNNTSDAMFMRASDGTVSQVLATADIVAVTGNVDGKAGFGDVFPAPDGKVYFYESYSDSILRFHPSDPAGTLQFFITEDELIAGTGTDSVYEIGWYDDSFAFCVFKNDKGLYVAPEPPGLDIKPGSCPNPFNRGSHGVLPVGLIGTPAFDVTMVDLATVSLSRADGVGGSVAPNEGPPGPHSVFADVATPFYGELCDCHELEGDGITDLSMKFKTDDVVANLLLNELDPGALVELVVSGELLDGTPFAVQDCIRLVPPGTPPGLLAVASNSQGAWIDMSPPDEQLDGGGFADFQRTFPRGSVVTLKAEAMLSGGLAFSHWKINGVREPSTSQTLSVVVTRGIMTIEAIYISGLPAPPTPTPVPTPGPTPVPVPVIR